MIEEVHIFVGGGVRGRGRGIEGGGGSGALDWRLSEWAGVVVGGGTLQVLPLSVLCNALPHKRDVVADIFLICFT